MRTLLVGVASENTHSPPAAGQDVSENGVNNAIHLRYSPD